MNIGLESFLFIYSFNLSSKLKQEKSSQSAAQQVGLLEGYASWTPEVGAMIGRLWQDRGIRQTYEQRSQFFQLDDSAG